MTLQDFLDPAVHRGERVGQKRRAGRERHPVEAGESRRALEAGAAGEVGRRASCSAPTMLTPNALALRMTASVGQTALADADDEGEGGSSGESEQRDVAVQPDFLSP